MPIKSCGKDGHKWGDHGTCYEGPGGREKAEKQAAAAFANGYKGEETKIKTFKEFIKSEKE